jgi:hypothetical protein
MNEPELRAKALGIAVQFLGTIPPKNPRTGEDTLLDNNDTYKDYLWLAKRIEKYISQGGTLF